MAGKAKKEKVFRVGTLIKTQAYANYADILTGAFGRQGQITKAQADETIKKHLSKEIK